MQYMKLAFFSQGEPGKTGVECSFFLFSVLFFPFFSPGFPEKHLEISLEMVDIRANIDYT